MEDSPVTSKVRKQARSPRRGLAECRGPNWIYRRGGSNLGFCYCHEARLGSRWGAPPERPRGRARPRRSTRTFRVSIAMMVSRTSMDSGTSVWPAPCKVTVHQESSSVKIAQAGHIDPEDDAGRVGLAQILPSRQAAGRLGRGNWREGWQAFARQPARKTAPVRSLLNLDFAEFVFHTWVNRRFRAVTPGTRATIVVIKWLGFGQPGASGGWPATYASPPAAWFSGQGAGR